MYIDSLLLLSDAQAFSADAASTNTIDLGNVTPKRNFGDGEPMAMCISVDVAADATTGDETYEFQFIQSANADLTSPDILMARAIARADLTLGSLHVVPIPPGAVTKRYIGGFFNGGGTTPTITATIWVTSQNMLQRYQSYAKGYTIS